MSLKILTVDDSKTIRLIVTKAFKPYDCSVLEADNGVVGLAVAGREKPDLILLDYTMPVMDGFEVLARLRSDPDLKSTPVIMLTAEAGRDTVVKIARLGVRDYLIKPFKEDLLIERVNRVLALKERSTATERPKRFDDPIRVLVLDDKPAITAQIKAAFEGTPWTVCGAAQTGEALDFCNKGGIDVILTSLSLPNDGAFGFIQTLRGFANLASIPMFGLSVRTATTEQAKAQQAGFVGIITKPIDAEELKAKIAKALKLETAYKYYRPRGSALVMTLPKDASPATLADISSQLNAQLTATVDAGGDQLIIDLSALEKASVPMVELIVAATESCSALSLKTSVVATSQFKEDCMNYEEAHSWNFAPSGVEEPVAA